MNVPGGCVHSHFLSKILSLQFPTISPVHEQCVLFVHSKIKNEIKFIDKVKIEFQICMNYIFMSSAFNAVVEYQYIRTETNLDMARRMGAGLQDKLN